MRHAAVIAAFALSCIGCHGRSPEQTWPFRGVPAERLASPVPNCQGVSLVALMGQPEQFDGKAIRVIGFGHLEFEGQALYLHREDFQQGLVLNSVALDVPYADSEFTRLNDRYVVVEGVFRAWPRGSSSLRAGKIEQVSRYDPWPSHETLRRETERLDRKTK